MSDITQAALDAERHWRIAVGVLARHLVAHDIDEADLELARLRLLVDDADKALDVADAALRVEGEQMFMEAKSS